MYKTLQKHYMILVLPGLGLFLVLGLAAALNLIPPVRLTPPSGIQITVFVAAAVTAIAGPLFLRTLFAHSVRDRRQVDTGRFLMFQRRLLQMSQTTVYLAFAAVLCEFPRFYSAAIVLMGLYAMYYHYPSQQRIDFDKKIFRVT
ncbi:MAG: hypothetical protein AB1Z81_03900 [Desulfotignum sp.]